MKLLFNKETNKIVLDMNGNTISSENDFMFDVDSSFIDKLKEWGVKFEGVGGVFEAVSKDKEQTTFKMDLRDSLKVEGDIRVSRTIDLI